MGRFWDEWEGWNALGAFNGKYLARRRYGNSRTEVEENGLFGIIESDLYHSSNRLAYNVVITQEREEALRSMEIY